MEENARKIKAAYNFFENRRTSIGPSLGRPTTPPQAQESHLAMRPTYFSPPNSDRTYSLFSEEIFGITSSSRAEVSSSDLQRERSYDKEDVNQFGFVKLRNGCYYNIYTLKESDTLLYE